MNLSQSQIKKNLSSHIDLQLCDLLTSGNVCRASAISTYLPT